MTGSILRHRLIALGLIIAHAVALVLLLYAARQPRPNVPPTLMVATTTADDRLAPAVVLEPKIRLVSIGVGPPEFETSEDITVPMAAPAATGGCALDGAVQAALGASGDVKGALDLVPPNGRSVSGATLIWDGAWANAAIVGGDRVLKPIEAIVAAVVGAAPADCRDALVTGPRFVFVTDAGGMHILGFGSGVWKWSQLLRANPALAVAAAVTAGGQK